MQLDVVLDADAVDQFDLRLDEIDLIFLALEHHSVDVPWWEDLVQGDKPLFNKGFANLPSRPGLGVTLNDDIVKQHLDPNDKGYFEPTKEWDTDRVNDRLWS